jgi:hypothetical protein
MTPKRKGFAPNLIAENPYILWLPGKGESESWNVVIVTG